MSVGLSGCVLVNEVVFTLILNRKLRNHFQILLFPLDLSVDTYIFKHVVVFVYETFKTQIQCDNILIRIDNETIIRYTLN